MIRKRRLKWGRMEKAIEILLELKQDDTLRLLRSIEGSVDGNVREVAMLMGVRLSKLASHATRLIEIGMLVSKGSGRSRRLLVNDGVMCAVEMYIMEITGKPFVGY